MKVCAISFKECWQDKSGTWYSFGGFPHQMSAIRSLFDEMTLVITETEPRDGGLPLPKDARVIPIENPSQTRFPRKLFVALNLPHYLKRLHDLSREADVIHVPLPGDIPLLGFVTALATRKKLLARYGSSWEMTDSTTTMNRITKRLMRRFSGDRNVMLVTGEGAEPPAAGLQWIFSTAIGEEELNRVRPNFGRGLSSPPNLVYIGRLSIEKGVDVLLRAIAEREGAGRPLHATIIGDGPERDRLKRLSAELGCADRIQFTGQLNRATMTEFLFQADFCVQPSRTEGYSKAWLDAMLHGLPVVASRVGAAEHVIGTAGERGWLVRPDDPSALAAALTSVVETDFDWPALRRQCRAFAESRTLEKWSDRIREICETAWAEPLSNGTA